MGGIKLLRTRHPKRTVRIQYKCDARNQTAQRQKRRKGADIRPRNRTRRHGKNAKTERQKNKKDKKIDQKTPTKKNAYGEIRTTPLFKKKPDAMEQGI